MYKFAYAIIEKATGFCSQVNKNNKPNWVLDNEYCYNIPLPVVTATEYAGKYFYNGKWWRREWEEVEAVDEIGNKYMEPTGNYTDYEWMPEAVNN